jgi:23S rRNA (pseudouridine1915-N3)-methyltransferase
MIQCTLITVGTLKEKYWTEALDEYKKRISAYAKWEEINIKEQKLADESPAAVHTALEAEADKILAKIPKDAYTVALCIEGKMLSSEELASLVEGVGNTSGKLCLIIGSSYGLSERVKARAELKLSLSRMTFPHQLARVLLAEAVYRAFTILAGKRYHK